MAVVNLGTGPEPDDAGLAITRTLRQKGFTVVCYGHGVHTWPVGAQCRAFLAGGTKLLDTAGAGFTTELARVLGELERAEDRRQREDASIRARMRELGIVAQSPAMLAVGRRVVRVSGLSDLPILITGETGTGKQLLAHAIHRLDPKRRHGPFVPLNCGAISPGLAESELFGHRRGAYTGAERERRGLVRSADGGCLFLDEIGELDERLQTKFLRVLQDHRVLGVGEDREVAVDVRIIAATNRELNVLVERGQFRLDLWHRLNILSIRVPPLRERPADIRPLIEHFVAKHGTLSVASVPPVSIEFAQALAQLALPGNTRQLENLVRLALVTKDDDSPLDLADLPPEVWHELSERGDAPRPGPDRPLGRDRRGPDRPPPEVPGTLTSLLESHGWNLHRSLQYCERLLLERALQAAHGNQSGAARLLGITARSVYNKVRRHQLAR